MTLYTRLKEAGIEVDNHESDLYFPKTKESLEILKFPLQKKNSSTFQNQITQSQWIDVPFAYDPYWEKVYKQTRKKEILEISSQNGKTINVSIQNPKNLTS
jgi:hypothetical protein